MPKVRSSMLTKSSMLWIVTCDSKLYKLYKIYYQLKMPEMQRACQGAHVLEEWVESGFKIRD